METRIMDSLVRLPYEGIFFVISQLTGRNYLTNT